MNNNLQQIIAVKQQVEDEWLGKPGVTGIEVGYKYVNGQRTDEIAVRVLVEHKSDTVPQQDRVPEAMAGIRTDVIERTFVLQQDVTNRTLESEIAPQVDAGTYSPVQGGISIGPCRSVGGYVYVGTLGAVVKDNATGNPMLLSNFHVMCIDAGWTVGDTMAQPSRVDGGTCPGSVTGSLQRAVLSSRVDGAVASLRGRGYSCSLTEIGFVTGTATATLGAAVRKRGRTTELTYGFVDGISLTVNLDYGSSIGWRTLRNQISIRPDTTRNPKFSASGDSGSVVVNRGRKVIGLLFAGSPADGFAIANQIADVLEELNVSMCIGVDLPTIPKEIADRVKGKPELKEFVGEHLLPFGNRSSEQQVGVVGKDLYKEGDKNIIKDYTDFKEQNEKASDASQAAGGWGQAPAGMPMRPQSGLEERIARIESAIATLSAFIGADLRPDLAAGALRNEEDEEPGTP